MTPDHSPQKPGKDSPSQKSTPTPELSNLIQDESLTRTHPLDMKFGPGERFSFSELGTEIADILKEIEAEFLEVNHVDGWDSVHLKLKRPVLYDIKKRVEELVESIDWQVKALLKFARRAQLAESVRYLGRLDSDGAVYAKEVSGIAIKTIVGIEVIPHEGYFHPDGTAHLTKATSLGVPLSKKFTLEPSLTEMGRALIVEFERLRRG